MRVFFVTQSEPFYIKFFFKRFLENYNPDHIKGIVIQNTLSQKKYSGIVRKALDFYGIKGFLYMGFKNVGIRISGVLSKFMNIQPNSIEQIVQNYGIPILKHKSVNSREFLDFILEEKIDLIISVAASEIFRHEVLHTPGLGCINIHSGPLPKYRGMMPIFWTLYNNEKCAWVTIHKMVEKLDDGPIVLQDKFKIMPKETYNSLAKRSKEFAARLLLEVLGQFERQKVNYYPNDWSKATYYSFPTKVEMRQFKKRGGRIF